MAAADGPAVAALGPSVTAPEKSSGPPLDSSGAPLPWWRKDWFVGLLFFAVTLVVYSRGLNGGFVWDDDSYISMNPDLRSPHGLWQIWFRPWGAGHQYYPLSFTVFWVGYHLWGLHTLGYHLVNVFFHSTTAVLLWRILKRLKVRGALLAGALFALHPVNVMSVAWMNELKNTLSGSLALGAIWAYLRFEGLGVDARQDNPERPRGWYAAALVLFLLAMLAKSAVSFLPVTLLLIIWWQRERIGRREIWPLLPMVGVVAGLGLLTIVIEHSPLGAGAVGKDFTVSFPQRLIVSGHSFFFYLGKLLLPLRLTFVYPRWQVNAWDWREYLYPAATAVVLAGLWCLRLRIGKGLWAAAMHFYISTSFLVFMVVLYRMRYSFVSDHWIYFGSMSIFALMGAGLATVFDGLGGWNNLLARRTAIGLFVLLGAMSWWQCGMYHDLQTLWKWTIARNPSCWMAENNLGNGLLEEGRVDESMGHFRRAIELKPDYVLAMNNLGNALMKKHDVDDAIVHYQTALAIKPDNPETLNDIGYAFQQKGRVVEAIGFYKRAIELKPDYAMARNNLASALLKEGSVADAIDLFRKTIEMVPDFAPALSNLAYLLATTRDPRLRDGVKAMEYAQKANQLEGGSNAIILDNLAAAYAEQGRYQEAVAVGWKALALALSQGNTIQAGLIQKHLAVYQARQPLRDN